MAWGVLVSVFFTVTPSFAALTTYVDDKGVKHVVQSADEIPEKFRKKAKALNKNAAEPVVEGKWTPEFCGEAKIAERKAKLQSLGKEEAQLVGAAGPEASEAAKEKIAAKHLQMDDLQGDIKGCVGRYKKEEKKEQKKP